MLGATFVIRSCCGSVPSTLRGPLISFYFMSRVYYLGSHAHSPPITKPPCTLRRSPQKLARTSFVPRTMVSRWGRRDRHPGSFIAGAYFTTLVYPAFPLFFPFLSMYGNPSFGVTKVGRTTCPTAAKSSASEPGRVRISK